MKAHWSDIFNGLGDKELDLSTASRSEKRADYFKKVLAATVIMRYDSTIPIHKNLDKLEIGQGYLKDGCKRFWCRKLLLPKKFKTYSERLVIRIN